jgi:sugar phosphate isomerase/epimerase
VECAEKYGVSMAIEPVWKHIVYSPERARIVLDAIGSRNLRIIFDPVNLLCVENMEQREEIFAKTIELLGDDIAVVHLKDFVPEGNDLTSIAAGTGMMDYRKILKFMKERKPFIQATLENTNNDNAVASRLYLENVYREL